MKSCAIAMLIAMLVLLSGCGASPSAEQQQLLREAQEASQQADSVGDHLAAAGRWQRVLDSGLRSSAAWYWLGDAFHRAGQRGRAIAAWRLALRSRPRDMRIGRRLVAAMDELPGATPISRLPWRRWLSGAEKVWLLGIACATVLTAAVWRRWRPQPAATRMVWAAGAATALAAGVALDDAWCWRWREPAVIVSAGAVPRVADADSAPAVVGEPFSEGRLVWIDLRRGDWVRVSGDGAAGWVRTVEIMSLRPTAEGAPDFRQPSERTPLVAAVES